LSDYLDEQTTVEIRAKLERHIAECPECFVVCDTTKKTIEIYKGQQQCTIPADIHARLIAALERKLLDKRRT